MKLLLLIGALYMNPITISVYPSVSLSTPATFRITVLAPRHEDNRKLCLGYKLVEEREPLRNSCQSMDGIWASRVRTVYWDIRSAGEYEAIAVLTRMELGSEKRYSQRQPFRVVGLE